MKKTVLYLSVACIFAAMFSFSAFAQGFTIYNSLPAPMPGNLPSEGFEANGDSEFGDRIQFAGTARSLISVTQTMSSWGCEAGHWYDATCVTTPDSGFTHPITLTVYNVGSGGSVGSVITTVTQDFFIPYRPSTDNEHCTGGRWWDGANCFNGFATNITFALPNVTVPNEVIYGISYNTSHFGYDPIGESSACYSSSAGCGYDSMNVAVDGVLSVGSNPDGGADAYYNTHFAANYCDGGLGGTDSFRLDSGCWTYQGNDYFPLPAKFRAANPPTSANDCKHNGWRTRTRLDGSTFRNQGDCIQYFNNGH